MLIYTWGLGPPPGGNLNTGVYKVESNHWESNPTKLRISRLINYMKYSCQSQIVRNLASCDFATLQRTLPILFQFNWYINLELFVCWFCPIDCTSPLGPDMKYSLLSVLSKWSDSQLGFWKNSDSVWFLNYQSKWLIRWECSKKIRLFKLEVR